MAFVIVPLLSRNNEPSKLMIADVSYSMSDNLIVPVLVGVIVADYAHFPTSVNVPP